MVTHTFFVTFCGSQKMELLPFKNVFVVYLNDIFVSRDDCNSS